MQKKGMMIVMIKKERMCRKRRNSFWNTHRTKTHHFKIQQRVYQGKNQQVGELIASIQIQGETYMRPRLAHSYSKSRNPKERDGTKSTTRQQSTIALLRWGQKMGSRYMEKGKQWLCLMSIHNCTTLIFLSPNTQRACTARKNVERPDLLILLKKSGMVKSK